jgi:hypothetical protein
LRSAHYFNELLIDINLVFSLGSRPFTMVMMAGEMPAAISANIITGSQISRHGLGLAPEAGHHRLLRSDGTRQNMFLGALAAANKKPLLCSALLLR